MIKKQVNIEIAKSIQNVNIIFAWKKHCIVSGSHCLWVAIHPFTQYLMHNPAQFIVAIFVWEYQGHNYDSSIIPQT